MPEIPRLNPAIRALESGKPAFVTFSPAEVGAARKEAPSTMLRMVPLPREPRYGAPITF